MLVVARTGMIPTLRVTPGNGSQESTTTMSESPLVPESARSEHGLVPFEDAPFHDDDEVIELDDAQPRRDRIPSKKKDLHKLLGRRRWSED